MNDVKILIKKIKNLTLDISAMVNNSVLLVLAWICVFWVFQFFTILPAFTMSVKMIVFNSFVDFNSVNTAASDQDLWSSADNVYNVFLTPVVFTFIFALVAVLFLIKWNSDRLNIRRFLFWVILCAIVRITGNYIFGHLLNLWSWNLVTDFMGITYPSVILKYTFIVLMVVIAARLFIAMSHEIKKLFNPYISDRFSNLTSNVFLPAVIGCCFLVIWNIPFLPQNEILNLVYMLVLLVLFMCRPFMRMYRGVEQERLEEEDNEQINLAPIIILAVLFLGDIFLMKGLLLENSAYRYFFIENAIMGLVVATLLITLWVSIKVYRQKTFAIKKIQKRRIAEIENIKSIPHSYEKENITQSDYIDMGKYKNAFKDNEDEDEEFPRIDLKNSEKYGFKNYNLKKYNNRYW